MKSDLEKHVTKLRLIFFSTLLHKPQMSSEEEAPEYDLLLKLLLIGDSAVGKSK